MLQCYPCMPAFMNGTMEMDSYKRRLAAEAAEEFLDPSVRRVKLAQCQKTNYSSHAKDECPYLPCAFCCSLIHTSLLCPEVRSNGTFSRDSLLISKTRERNRKRLKELSADIEGVYPTTVAEVPTFFATTGTHALNLSIPSTRHNAHVWQEATRAWPALGEEVSSHSLGMGLVLVLLTLLSTKYY